MNLLRELLLLDDSADDSITAGIRKVAANIKAGWDAKKGQTEKTAQKLDAKIKIAIKNDIEKFVAEFFDKFPNQGGAGGAEDLLKVYTTRAAVLEGFKAFNALSKRITSLRSSFNSSLVQSGKVTRVQMTKYQQDVDKIMASVDPTLPPALINFVKKENTFFKRLVKVDNDFQLDDSHFKELLSAKIKLTAEPRVPDATQAMNLLLAYMAEEFAGHARVIADAGSKLPTPKVEVNEDEQDQADKAARRKKDAIDKRKEAEREAEKKQREAEAAAKKAVNAEKKVKVKAEREAEVSAKAAAAEHKAKSAESIGNLKKDLEDFVGEFFDQFPVGADKNDAEIFLQKYPTREAAVIAFKAFRNISKRLEQLLTAMNRSLNDRGKITTAHHTKFGELADLAKDGKLTISRPLIQFARSEAKFFKRLLTITDNNKLYDEDFKQLLALKMNQTNPVKVPDAAEALNRLLGVMVNKLNARAKGIADVGRTLDNEHATSKKATRDGAAAAAAAEIESIAKTQRM